MEWQAAVGLVALALPFIFFQRRLHNEIILLIYLITRHAGVAQVVFSIIFLPGVLLHELSHLIMAWLLRVRTGRFSILPRSLPGGRLRLGYVETEPTDFVRDTLIGAAPPFSGGIAVALIGLNFLGIDILLTTGSTYTVDNLLPLILSIPKQPDFAIWFYLIFTISSTMLPSASDRRSWLVFGLVLLGLISLVLILGAGPWLAANLGSWVNKGLNSITLVVAISLVTHLILLIPIYTIRTLLTWFILNRSPIR